MAKKNILNLTSLKDQVYQYIRHQMKIGALRPGSVIDMNATSEKLGVSRTPLRDALIQLEMEEFVNILPRRGVFVNPLTIEDIKDYYQLLGALESTAIIAASELIDEQQVKKLEKWNESLRKALDKDDFDAYYERNLKFHDIFLDLCGNRVLKKTVHNLKKRLYDFPRRKGFIREWEESAIHEHQHLIKLVSEKKYLDAANFMRDYHWSFKVQEKFVRRYYAGHPDRKE